MAGRPEFGISSSQLRELFEQPKENAVETLNSRYGGEEGIASAVHVDPTRGLASDDTNDLSTRAEWFGANRVPIPKQRGLLLLMWDALHDVTLVILLVAGLVSLIVGLVFGDDKATDWIEGFAILMAVFVVTLVGATNDYQKEKQFRKLNAVKEDALINVLRDSLIKQISKYDVVVGDVLPLGQGDEIVADGIVIESSSLSVNESALTGESDDIKKNRDAAPFLFSGTQVMDGVGRMLVLCVGVNSQAGIIDMLITGQAKQKKGTQNVVEQAREERPSLNALAAPSVDVVDLDTAATEMSSRNGGTTSGKTGKEQLSREPTTAIDIGTGRHGAVDAMSVANAKAVLQEADDEAVQDVEDNGTILQQKLAKLAIMISYVGMAAGILTWLVMTIRFCIETYTERGWESGDFSSLLDFFIIGVTVLVVAIPEGLPLAVTLALAYSMTQMIKENNLVRHLDACETMGNATTVCSDKTGTLTTNRMTVTKARIGNVETNGEDPVACGVNPDVAEILNVGIAVNSTAEVQRPASGVGPCDHLGNKTECALLQYTMDMGADYTDTRAKNKPVHLSPFNSAKKRMSSVTVSGENYRVHTKGASEIVVDLCNNVRMEDGSVVPMTPALRQELLQTIESYATESLRTLCLAYKDIPAPEGEISWDSVGDELDQGLTCLMIVGIEDPVRPEVPGAIKQCERAGITVRMVTGDNVTTARAVARKCGILVEERGDTIMEGPEFRKRVIDARGNIKQEEFDKIWPTLRVLARSSPTDKYDLVSGLLSSELGGGKEVVAVTGDGTNDAPALKRADIGFAMGIQGTAVAKNASDIILMDDNFSSIICALKWGRNIYDSISKFVQFQLTVNVVALIIAFTSAAITETTPLTAVQLLWVNLIMDTLAALALATEKPTDALLDRKPYGRNKALISRRMWWFIIMHAAYQLAIVYFILYGGPAVWGYPSGHDANGVRTEHYTMVFNTFVLLQLFNEINARKLRGEVNVFKGFFSNWFFVIIMVVQFTCQILIVEFGGEAFKCTPLSWNLWLWCVLMGAGELVWNQIINLIPVLIPKSWRVRMSSPLKKGFWVKSKRRMVGGLRATRPFRKSMKTHNEDQIEEHCDRLDALLRHPAHITFYESAWHVILASSKSPKVRLRAAVHIVQERIRAEHYYQDRYHDDLMKLKAGRHH